MKRIIVLPSLLCFTLKVLTSLRPCHKTRHLRRISEHKRTCNESVFELESEISL